MHLVHVHVGQSGILAGNVQFRLVHMLIFIIIVVLLVLTDYTRKTQICVHAALAVQHILHGIASGYYV